MKIGYSGTIFFFVVLCSKSAHRWYRNEKGNYAFTQILFFVLVFFVIILLFMLIDSKVDSDYDLLSFFGSIIGGLLTLFGVRLTINLENKNKYIESLPDKIKMMSDIVSSVRNKKKDLEQCVKYDDEEQSYWIEFKLLVRIVPSFIDLCDLNTHNAIKSSRAAFNVLTEIKGELKEFWEWLDYNDQGFYVDEELQKPVEDLVEKIEYLLKKLEGDHERLMGEFYKYNDK